MIKQDVRIWIVRGIVVFLGLVLLIKVAILQLFSSKYYEKANAIAIDKLTQYPARGLVYDRNGKLMVYNNAMYDLLVTYKRIDPHMDTVKFCTLLGISVEDFKTGIQKDWTTGKYSKSIPFVFIKNIPADVYARFQENLPEFPGFEVQVRNVRGYSAHNAANVLGYIKEADPKVIDTSGGIYLPGDYLGATGLEKTYESLLKGQKGVKYILKDNLGRQVGPYNSRKSDTSAISGLDVLSSIDLDLQAFGETLMVNKTGSIVAIEPSTGEILAMVTAPNFDPNILKIDRNRGDAFRALLQDSLKPFFDRSTMARYPPGSTFKTVLSLIGQQMGVLWPDRAISCPGGYYYNGFRWGCRVHPSPRDIPTALQYSCNTYYYTALRSIVDKYDPAKPWIGLDTLNSYLERFGLGKPLKVDVNSETRGNIPTPAYYDKIYGKKAWRSTFILSIGVGQGEIELSTLQMANIAAIIANNGYFITPHLVKGYKDTSKIIEPRYLEKNFVGVDSRHFEPVVEGMARVVSNGTARAAYIPDIAICAKTGTSQNPHGEDHSVFIGFAPRDNPKIAVAVYVENAGHGGDVAAPIASLIIEKYIRGKLSATGEYRKEKMMNTDIIHRPKKVKKPFRT